ncbi:MAG: hypothetical protein GEU93_02460 [Propionibacteriales bacterium]|nr:hypothetical protein [Propionibacteriales bacterium]
MGRDPHDAGPDGDPLTEAWPEDERTGDEAWEFDADGYLRDVSATHRAAYGPPPRPGVPLPVMDVPTVKGRRVVLMTAAGPIYDHRAASEVYTDESGSWITVATERAWYVWQASDQRERPELGPPGSRAWAAVNVYVEVYADGP